MKRPNFEDFRREDGHVDWTALRAAEVAAGYKCSRCHGYLLFGSAGLGAGMPTECAECASRHRPEKWLSHREVRCPKCQHTWNPAEEEDYELYEDGYHEATCSSCGHEFELSTTVTYLFESPAIEESDDRNDKEDV